MQMYEILNKKKLGHELLASELNWVVQSFVCDKIPSYQMSALLMAIYFKGMTLQETVNFTMAMVDSGCKLDLSSLGEKTFDKHSTGGVGDKTTLIVVPILAALGLTVAKMSGRGLGFTGGTIDKLESIPNIKLDYSTEEFLKIAAKTGMCISSQSGNLVPADKKIYALRDVTATVDSIPLIAASIMSKKIAAGAKHILLDVKCGKGAFMKNLDEAKELAKCMVNIGIGCGRKTAAIITNMSAPLGYAIGNSLEVKEAIEVLTDYKHSSPELTELCINLASHMLYLAGEGDITACRTKVEYVLETKKALKKFTDLIEAQGGDKSYIESPENFNKASYVVKIKAPKSGFISSLETEEIGVAAMMLGAGRVTAEADICYSSGIVLCAKYGDYVNEGQVIAELHTNDIDSIKVAEQKFIYGISFSEEKVPSLPLIYDLVGFEN